MDMVELYDLVGETEACSAGTQRMKWFIAEMFKL
jgi:hypothetical protein